ncbi:MAG: GldG family protein [Bdellovibrionales bacterium]|nr:GldG family protein [Bdellovibrionales bacterium]
MKMKKWYNVLLAIINSIFYLVVIALWISIPEELTLNLAVTAVSLGLTLGLIFINRQMLAIYYQSHHFKKLQETIVFFSLVFCLFGVVNYWAYKHPKQFDTSVIKLNSLSDQSKNVLKELSEPIVFKMFARKTESLPWMALLEFYRAEKSSIQIEKIDIDVRPDLVGDYQISDAATLVIEYKGKRQKVTERDELNITNALIKISRPSDPVVYFVQGHEEGDISSQETEGLKFIYEAAKNSALDIRPINLLSTQEIPFDAKALVLWGPRKTLQPSELNVIKKFLERKGNLMVAIDPDLNGDLHANLRELLRNYKMIVRNDMVMDKKSFVNGSNGSIPLVDHFDQENPITKSFKGQIFFPLAASLDPIPDEVVPELKGTVKSLASSTPFPESWGETSLKEVASQQMSYTQGQDRPGPLSLALAFESPDNRIVAFGNSTFVLNAYSKFGSNYIFFLNSLSWAVGEDRLISFNLPIVQSQPVFISAPQIGIIFYFSVLFSPLILFGTAVFMYRRKRDK